MPSMESQTTTSCYCLSTKDPKSTQHIVGCDYHVFNTQTSDNTGVFNGIGAWTETMEANLNMANGRSDPLQAELDFLNNATRTGKQNAHTVQGGMQNSRRKLAYSSRQ